MWCGEGGVGAGMGGVGDGWCGWWWCGCGWWVVVVWGWWWCVWCGGWVVVGASVAGGFHSQMACNAESVSTSRHHHDIYVWWWFRDRYHKVFVNRIYQITFPKICIETVNKSMSVGGRSDAGLLHAPPSATPPGSCARQAKLIPETIWVVEQTTLVHKECLAKQDKTSKLSRKWVFSVQVHVYTLEAAPSETSAFCHAYSAIACQSSCMVTRYIIKNSWWRNPKQALGKFSSSVLF